MNPRYIFVKRTITFITGDGGEREWDETREEFSIFQPAEGAECPQEAGMAYGDERDRSEVLLVFEHKHTPFLNFICPLLMTDQGSCSGAEVLADMIAALGKKKYKNQLQIIEDACAAAEEFHFAYAKNLVEILRNANKANDPEAESRWYEIQLEAILRLAENIPSGSF